jgi:hypothetical protein
MSCPKAFTILGIFLLFAQQSIASDNCTDVDLRAEIGPVRSQGDIGWCYANAAADLLSFYYRHESNYKDFSAVQLAFIHNFIYRSDALSEGGLVGFTIDGTNGHGLCERRVENEARQSVEGSLKDAIRYVQNIKTKYDSWRTIRDPKLQQDYLKDIEGLRRRSAFFRKIPSAEYLQLLENSNTNDFLEQLAQRSCHGRTFFSDRHPQVKRSGYYVFDLGLKKLIEDQSGEIPHRRTRNVRLLNEIDAELSAQNIVGIAYFADFLTNPKPTLDGRHMSVLVGRRKNRLNNQCEYLVRNSWGKKCSGYVHQENCEDGHIWVTKMDLKNNLYGITYLK